MIRWPFAPWPSSKGAAPLLPIARPGQTAARRANDVGAAVIRATATWPATMGAAPVITEAGATTPAIEYWHPVYPHQWGPGFAAQPTREAWNPFIPPLVPLDWSQPSPLPRLPLWPRHLWARARGDTPSQEDIYSTMWEPTYPRLPTVRPLRHQPSATGFFHPPPAADTAPWWIAIYPSYIWPKPGLAAHRQAWQSYTNTTPSPVPPLDSWAPTFADFARTLRAHAELWPAVMRYIGEDIAPVPTGGRLAHLIYRYKHHH